MELLYDSVTAFFCAIGIATVVWWMADWVFRTPPCPMPHVHLVLQVQDDAPTLQQDLRILWRLRRQVPYATIVIQDCGLTKEARRSAEDLCAHHKLTQLQD